MTQCGPSGATIAINHFPTTALSECTKECIQVIGMLVTPLPPTIKFNNNSIKVSSLFGKHVNSLSAVGDSKIFTAGSLIQH